MKTRNQNQEYADREMARLSSETKPTHTPGPWEVTAHKETRMAKPKFTIGNGIQVADCNVRAPQYDNGEVEANARLIAAAPTLLSVAKELYAELIKAHGPNWIGPHTSTEFHEAISQVEGA